MSLFHGLISRPEVEGVHGMRRLFIIFLFFLVTAATLKSCLGLAPTMLRVHVIDRESGADITKGTRILVGYAPKHSNAAPTLGNIHIVRPEVKHGNVYSVPALEYIAVFAMLPGQEPVSKTIRVGNQRMHDLELLVDVARIP